jgi:AraC-like DNA-binding protein
LDNIAGEAYFSKFHFLRLFKKIYGKTPHQYLVTVRLKNASLLLKKGTTVSEACHAVGFESLSSFSSLFRKHQGMSPSAYLLFYQEKTSAIQKLPLAFIPGCFAQKHGWKE